ncbi:MAG: hypothetical protein NXI24_17325 [bacterium]|nr:hypothetical protein [bacterium]
MKKTMKRLSVLFVILFVAGATELAAADHVIFVHGRSGSNHCGTGTSDVNNYWGNSKNINTSVTRYYVGYDGSKDPRSWGSCRAQSNLYSVLESRCTGSNRCKVICHSAGCYATEYFLDKTSRSYNIDWVMASSSAAGGSELADLAFWASNDMVSALKTGNARGSYNHNDTKGVGIWSLAGYDGDWYSAWYLPGEDDGAVSFHSTCGHSSKGSHSRCNKSKYSNHYIWGGNSSSDYSSYKQGYDRTHVGDGGSSINTSMKQEWNRCKSSGWGCK